jgi:hypothetical protein
MHDHDIIKFNNNLGGQFDPREEFLGGLKIFLETRGAAFSVGKCGVRAPGPIPPSD